MVSPCEDERRLQVLMGHYGHTSCLQGNVPSYAALLGGSSEPDDSELKKDGLRAEARTDTRRIQRRVAADEIRESSIPVRD